MNRISVCLVTLNEEHNLSRALHSVEGIADEIVVVDSGSTDRTPEIARQYGATLLIRPWTNYSEQRNFAAAQASNEWILALDADEELSPELQATLLRWKECEPNASVYEMARMTWYLGAWIHHTRLYPDYQRRLYRRDAAQFERIIHESLRFPGLKGRLQGDLLHYTFRSLIEQQEKIERYTTLGAEQMYAAGKRSWRGGMWLGSAWAWFNNYVRNLGLLDGRRGWLISRMAARTVYLKYNKLGWLVREGAKSHQR